MLRLKELKMKKFDNEKLVFNNATFSNFARIEKLELIFYISKNIYTTKEVIAEAKRGIKKKPRLQSIVDSVSRGQIKVQTLKKINNILWMNGLIQEGRLGSGEISAMALAKELGGIFITDEEKATKKAVSEGIGILEADTLGLNISNKNKFKDTVIFLEILKKKRIISQRDFNNIRILLSQENFIF